MNESEAKKIILDRIVVTPQRVVVAKAIVLSNCQKISSADDLISAVLKANDVAIPRQVVIHQSADQEPALIAAGYICGINLAIGIIVGVTLIWIIGLP